MAHELPSLPYEKNALEPYISAKTLEFHYGKHHAGYVAKLNKLIIGGDYENSSLEEIIEKASGGIFNNAAQIWNHTFYWNSLSPNGGGEPTGAVAEAIIAKWGSFDKFKAEFALKSTTLFGSGWCWLVKKGDHLEITQSVNAGTPLSDGRVPLLTCDVWEHAYYLDYQNGRAGYVDAFWNLVNWDFANENFNK